MVQKNSKRWATIILNVSLILGFGGCNPSFEKKDIGGNYVLNESDSRDTLKLFANGVYGRNNKLRVTSGNWLLSEGKVKLTNFFADDYHEKPSIYLMRIERRNGNIVLIVNSDTDSYYKKIK